MLPFHNMIFFHNYCPIDSTTMSTAYSQHIYIVLFKTTLHSILALLFIYAFLFTMWYFSTMTAQLTLHQCLQHILNIYIRYLFTITLPRILTLLFIYASFTKFDIFSQLLHNWLYNNVCSISATYTYSTVYNYSPMYTGFAVYICFLYTMWYFFTITAQFTLQQCLQHILNLYIQYCLQLHNPVYCMCFYICFLSTMWYFFTITAQLTLQQCL